MANGSVEQEEMFGRVNLRNGKIKKWVCRAGRDVSKSILEEWKDKEWQMSLRQSKTFL